MTCTNCGKELSPEMKFCENCGTKVEQPIPNTPEINQVSEISTNEIAPQPPKKSKKGLVIGIIIVALIAVVAIAFPLLKNLFTKTFASNEDYFKSTEKANAENTLDLLVELSDTYNNYSISDTEGLISFFNSNRYDMDLSLDLNEDITDNISGLAGTDLSFLKNILLGYGMELDGDNASITLSLGLENKKLLTVDIALDIKSFVAYVTIPELSNTAMKLDLEELTGEDLSAMLEGEEFKQEFENAMAIYGKLPDGKTLKSIATRYLNVALGQVKTVEKTDKTVTLNGKDSKYTQLSTVFTPDDLEALSIALLEELKNDEQIWGILEELSQALPELSTSRNDFNDEYDNMIADMDGTFDDLGNVTYAILVNKTGSIVGRELITENGDLIKFMCNENGFVLDTKEDGYDAVSLKFNGNLFADVCHGDGLLTVEGVDMLNIKVENTKSDGSEAKLTFTPAEGLTEELKYMQETSDISQILGVDLTKCSIVLKIMSEFDENSIRGNMKYGIALTTAEGPVASITANMEYSEPDGVELPADFKIVNDEDGIIEWINTADIFGFIASLPEGVSSLITGLMMSNVMG